MLRGDLPEAAGIRCCLFQLLTFLSLWPHHSNLPFHLYIPFCPIWAYGSAFLLWEHVWWHFRAHQMIQDNLPVLRSFKWMEGGSMASSSQKSLSLYKGVASQNCHTNIAQMGGPNSKFYFVVLEARVQDPRCQLVWFPLGPLCLALDGHLRLGPHRVFLMHSWCSHASKIPLLIGHQSYQIELA